jgi:hypothetical protein
LKGEIMQVITIKLNLTFHNTEMGRNVAKKLIDNQVKQSIREFHKSNYGESIAEFKTAIAEISALTELSPTKIKNILLTKGI